jgi:D-serine dehydratase
VYMAVMRAAGAESTNVTRADITTAAGNTTGSPGGPGGTPDGPGGPGDTTGGEGAGPPRGNALRGELDLPVLVLHDAALRWNIERMSRYCADAGVDLAPHAKTSMSPEITRRQLEAGAWAVTAATPAQVRTLYGFGVPRIMLANVLVDDAAIRWVARHPLGGGRTELYCYVDGVAGLDRLERSLGAAGAERPLRVLVEIGYAGGRTGVRSAADAVELAGRVSRSRRLSLAGLAGFEGLMPRTPPDPVPPGITEFLASIRTAAERFERAGLWGQPAGGAGEPPIITAGGSSYFDLVVRELGPDRFDFPVRTVLRSGCYVTHDHGIYEDTSPLGAGRGGGPAGRRFRPALELLASVWSRPEPGLVIAGFGRRNVPTDDRLPVVLGAHTETGLPVDTSRFRVTGVNDQHAFVDVPAGSEIAVGDVLGLGVSHPCGAFDRWRSIPVVDERYDAVDRVTVRL